jgi:nucleoside-diphosphate-sugar epimerase
METGGIAGDVINLGNPNEMTVLGLAEHVKRMVNADSKISFQPLPPDDPMQRRPDIKKAKKLLGWEPKVGLDEGLKKTVRWFQQVSLVE